MSKFSSSSLFLLLALLRPGAATEDAHCSGAFLSGKDNFVLYTEDSVKEGAALLETPSFSTDAECERACCKDPRCNLALLEPRGTATHNRTCVLFDCVQRNRFVCRFVSQDKYQSYIRESVFQKYLGTRQKSDEKDSPIANAGRDVTVQPGETVTLNGTESLARGDAEIKDYRWSLESGGNNVKMEKTDLPDQVQLSNLQPGSYVFKLTVTDSNGQSDNEKVTVLVLNPQQTSLYCRAPTKVGPCRAAFTRWHYNATKGDCEQFVFGGCKGNNNNFLSKEHHNAQDLCVSMCVCVSVCVFTEVCDSPCGPDQLTCDSGCCLDRSLECDNVKQCSDGSDENQCNKLNQTLSLLLDISVNQKKAQCTEPPRTGPCRAKFTHWYYDPLSKKCHRFTFGGCDGNTNNFVKKQECIKACDESDVFPKSLFERSDLTVLSTGSITLAVILSVGIMALLAILAYCFLKARRKRTHRPVNSTAHEALPEEDTSVYNSTTKPV
uniref:Serine peptidase inhibitor, Kunitz type 1 b n=1 Tax=Amphilophus citrinellus TaxID=61819 RepID=A0A3Q0SKX7_AMPCI